MPFARSRRQIVKLLAFALSLLFWLFSCPIRSLMENDSSAFKNWKVSGVFLFQFMWQLLFSFSLNFISEVNINLEGILLLPYCFKFCVILGSNESIGKIHHATSWISMYIRNQSMSKIAGCSSRGLWIITEIILKINLFWQWWTSCLKVSRLPLFGSTLWIHF